MKYIIQIADGRYYGGLSLERGATFVTDRAKAHRINGFMYACERRDTLQRGLGLTRRAVKVVPADEGRPADPFDYFQ